MRTFGLVGWSNSGKTTLMIALLEFLTARGVRVSTLKHSHHAMDIDRPGKDSWRHRYAGAGEVLVASARRWAIVHELADDEVEPTLDELLARLSPTDLVLVEGFKRERHQKLEVFRPSTGEEPLWPKDPTIIAVATDEPLPGCDRLILDINDPPAIARFILTTVGWAGDDVQDV